MTPYLEQAEEEIVENLDEEGTRKRPATFLIESILEEMEDNPHVIAHEDEACTITIDLSFR